MATVTYYALVDFDGYAQGEIIPGAIDWPFIHGYVGEGKVAPVLVATLPEDVQEALAELDEPVDDETTVDADTGEVDEADEEEESEEEEEGYDAYTVEELLSELASRGVEHKSGLRKADLIALLEEDDETDPEGE